MEIFFTADTHFNHANIIKYCNRPFNDVEEMNTVMFESWNKVVGQNDLVYVIGDFIFGWTDQFYNKILSNLNGDIILIKGNHDKTSFILQKKKNFFKEIKFYEELRINKQKVCLFHYPIEEWNGKHHGSIHLHGHSHGNASIKKNRYDVGVDVNEFTPVSLDEIIQITSQR